MRGQNGGRFDIDYERSSILSGITEDLQKEVGQSIHWWRFDKDATVVDDVYDVGASTGGRRWHEPFILPTVSAVIIQGPTRQNIRGFYNTDTLRVTINIKDIDTNPHFQDMLSGSLNNYLIDRVVYRDEVFIPTRLYPRGILVDQYTMLTFDANQVNPEELVNDPQFLQYAV